MIDLLIIKPSEDCFEDKKRTIEKRLEENLPNQESPNIGVAYIIANVKKHNLTVEYIDMEAYSISIEKLIKIIKDKNPILIGFKCYTVNFYPSLRVAKIVKDAFPLKQICFGGPHVTALPLETIEENDFIDFVICGEAEEIIVGVINDLKKGKKIKQLKGVVSKYNKLVVKHSIGDLDLLPYPSWESVDLNKFPGYMPHETKLELPISTSRGCPFKCIFCAHNHGRRKKRRCPESVIKEIEYMIEKFNVEAFMFIDETFVLNMKESRHLFNLMIESGLNKKIKWGCEGRVDLVEDGLFKLMKEAGCYSMFFGLESGDNEILKICKKNTTVEQIKLTVNSAKEVGILTSGSFIIGLPGDTEKTVMKSINLGIELDLYSTTFPIAIPLPGSELRDMAIRNEYGLKIISNDWSLYGKQEAGVMESKDLSVKKRMELQDLAYKLIPKKSLHEYIETRFKKV